MSDAYARFQERLDESARRFDQLRRTYGEVPQADYDKAFRKDFLWGWNAIVASLSEAFGERPLLPPDPHVKSDPGGIRVIGGKRPRRSKR